MPRFEAKATKIAYKILGVPPNIAAHKTKKEKKIDKRLVFEETARAR